MNKSPKPEVDVVLVSTVWPEKLKKEVVIKYSQFLWSGFDHSTVFQSFRQKPTAPTEAHLHCRN